MGFECFRIPGRRFYHQPHGLRPSPAGYVTESSDSSLPVQPQHLPAPAPPHQTPTHTQAHAHTQTHMDPHAFITICVHTHKHTYTHTHIHAFIHTSIYTWVHVCTYTNTHLHIPIYTQTHIHTSLYAVARTDSFCVLHTRLPQAIPLYPLFLPPRAISIVGTPQLFLSLTSFFGEQTLFHSS